MFPSNKESLHIEKDVCSYLIVPWLQNLPVMSAYFPATVFRKEINIITLNTMVNVLSGPCELYSLEDFIWFDEPNVDWAWTMHNTIFPIRTCLTTPFSSSLFPKTPEIRYAIIWNSPNERPLLWLLGFHLHSLGIYLHLDPLLAKQIWVRNEWVPHPNCCWCVSDCMKVICQKWRASACSRTFSLPARQLFWRWEQHSSVNKSRSFTLHLLSKVTNVRFRSKRNPHDQEKI